jgi:hypothetical protein
MKTIKKSDLDSKICKTCQKPFSWRKKWAKEWEHVLYCSERCRRNKTKSETINIG